MAKQKRAVWTYIASKEKETTCLRCRRKFKSPDVTRVRVCCSCKALNAGESGIRVVRVVADR